MQRKNSDIHRPAKGNRVIAICNPASGNASPRETQQQLSAQFESGLVDFIETKPDEHYPHLMDKVIGQDPDLIVLCGGDGTITKCASRLVGKNIPVLIYPTGTANILARSLGWEGDVDAPKDGITLSQALVIDAIKVNTDYCFSHVSIGMHAKITQLTSPEQKKWLGRFAYFLRALKLIPYETSKNFQVEIDGQKGNFRASSIIITNAGELGFGDMKWGPGIDPTDGVLNISVVKGMSIKEYFVVAWKLFRKDYKKVPQCSFHKLHKSIAIRTKRPQSVRGDGENLGKTPATIEIIPKALKVYLPLQQNRKASGDGEQRRLG